MNSKIKALNIEKILFFDIETVRNNEELDLNSKEFDLYQKKNRLKDTDELLPDNEVVELYHKKGGLRPIYNRIVNIVIGAVKDGKVYLKSFTGEEKDIIKNFYEATAKYEVISGYNLLNFDLPITRINSLRYMQDRVIDYLPERFNDSGKKPWELKNIVDFMDIFKGTYFNNLSLDEVCYLLDIPSPKEGGIDGSQVSEVYYSEGVDRIAEYCKRDVLSVINVFQVLRGEEVFTEFKDISEQKEKPLTLLEKIMQQEIFEEEKLQEIILTLNDEEKEIALEIVKACYLEKGKKKLPKKISDLFKSK
jgi:predicted PolB exonuclease-like 3'-5' exonuclease